MKILLAGSTGFVRSSLQKKLYGHLVIMISWSDKIAKIFRFLDFPALKGGLAPP